MRNRLDFHKCARLGCRIWIEWNKKYCNDCHKLYFGTNVDLGFYDPEYAKGDGDLKVYEGSKNEHQIERTNGDTDNLSSEEIKR